AWYWYNDRSTDQCNRIENPDVNLSAYGHLIFDKGPKSIKWGETVFLTNGAGKTGYPSAKK
ncbi:hypothetical protein NG726_40375, partial [Pseudomonas sp. MOB-449]|nr:hypothetical protein [Pseudomonas sp. MOB-449]